MSISEHMDVEERKSEHSVRMSEFANSQEKTKQRLTEPKTQGKVVREGYGKGTRPMKHWVKPTHNWVIVGYKGDLDKEPKDEYSHEPITDPGKIESELLRMPNTLCLVDYFRFKSPLDALTKIETDLQTQYRVRLGN